MIVAPHARAGMLALLLAQMLIACSPDASAGRTPPASSKARTAPAIDTVDLGGPSYRVVALTSVGSVRGVVTRLDTTALTAADAMRDSLAVECGSPPRKTKRRSAAFVTNAVVWVAGVAAGKPMSEEKRAELESADCSLDPGMLAIGVGTTVNVSNDDRVLHRLLFTREGTHDTITVMPFFNEGEIVPSERLSKMAGVIDVTCVFHPSTRGRVIVFAHPYFATTNDAGRFTIDSLPPGSYTLHVWRSGAARPTNQTVTITAGSVTTAEAAIK
ncbi:MAG: carboxypeptidase regulatory-like domain-containing protein [Gemmatimonadaceae bacterium]